MNAAANRFAVLTIAASETRREMRAVVPAEQVKTLQEAARALHDVGFTVTLKWGTAPDSAPVEVVQAMVQAYGFGPGKPVAYRLVRNPYGEVVVWLIMEQAKGRGYMVARGPSGTMQTIMGAPVYGNPRYHWGIGRCKKADALVDGAAFISEWIDL